MLRDRKSSSLRGQQWASAQGHRKRGAAPEEVADKRVGGLPLVFEEAPTDVAVHALLRVQDRLTLCAPHDYHELPLVQLDVIHGGSLQMIHGFSSLLSGEEASVFEIRFEWRSVAWGLLGVVMCWRL